MINRTQPAPALHHKQEWPFPPPRPSVMAASPSPPPAPSPASASPDVPLGSTDSARPLLDGGQEIGGGGDRGGDALRRPFLSLSPLMFHPSAARSLSRVAVATPAAVRSSSPPPFRVLQAHTDPSYLASIARRERNARAHVLDKLERQRTEEDRARQQLVDRQEQFRPAHDANDLETGVHAPLREPTQGAAFREHLHHASASVWGIPKLRENQIAAVERILLDATCLHRLENVLQSDDRDAASIEGYKGWQSAVCSQFDDCITIS